MKCICTIAALAVLAVMTPALHGQTPPVAFNWIEYSGIDVSATAPLQPGEYRNPILTGFYPDPSICQAGDYYYLIHSSFAYFPGLPIFRSADLVNWEQIGHVIHRPEQLRYDRLGVSEGIFAPAIKYHDGVFYVICTMVGSNGNFVVTATDPAGPWSDPTILRFGGIDPSIFFDDDGRAWVVNNDAPEGRALYDGHRAIWIQELDVENLRMTGPRTMLIDGGVDISTRPIWIEGPHIYKRNGLYYLSCAEGGTGPQHTQVVFRSENVEGPYTPWENNPILTQRHLDANVPGAVTCTGHASFVTGPDGKWWTVFLGVRPYDGDASPMGRETFLLPMTWPEGGWPMILPLEDRVPLVVKSPAGVSPQLSDAPLNGSFTWHEDFRSDELAHLWIMLRTPSEEWWKLDPEAGQLHLTPRLDRLTGRGNPSYLARRVQHWNFTTMLELEPPQSTNVAAGLVVFQNEQNHYFLSVQQEGEGLLVSLQQARGRGRARSIEPTVLASAQLPSMDTVTLRAQGEQAAISFSYLDRRGRWQTLVTDADARMLTSALAGGFVGATVGPHALLLEAPAEEAPAAPTHVPGTNPIVRDRFTADPFALVVDDTVYLYVGHDQARGDEMFNLQEWLCYSSKDMRNWTAHGPIMRATDFEWAVADAWASHMVQKDDKFYFYTTVQHDDTHRGKAIGVAVSDSPTGPFVDARGSALVYDAMTPNSRRPWEDIDPAVFIDDDGTAYMTWGNGDCYFVPLKPNMTELDGDIGKIELPHYVEGPWIHKREDTYYLTYAAMEPGVGAEQIAYATAPSIHGPWTYRGLITGTAKNSYTIHPAIIAFKDQWYFFYHNAALTIDGVSGAVGRRAVCVEYLEYNPDGTIKPITQTEEGVSGPPPSR